MARIHLVVADAGTRSAVRCFTRHTIHLITFLKLFKLLVLKLKQLSWKVSSKKRLSAHRTSQASMCSTAFVEAWLSPMQLVAYKLHKQPMIGLHRYLEAFKLKVDCTSLYLKWHFFKFLLTSFGFILFKISSRDLVKILFEANTPNTRPGQTEEF